MPGMLRALMIGQHALVERLARDGAQGEGDSNSYILDQYGADTGGNLPAPCVEDGAREELVEGVQV